MPRDSLPKPFEGYPAYGAVHDVIPSTALRNFMSDFASFADGIFELEYVTKEVDPTPQITAEEEFEPIVICAPEGHDSEEIETEEPLYDPRKYYRVFNVETMGVSVIEMDPSSKTAKTIRTLWERQDFGIVEQEAKNHIHKHIPRSQLTLAFDRVQGVGGRLPNVPHTDLRQKLALWPDTSSYPETTEIIAEEAGIVISGIARRLKQFIYPWDITPHLTFAVFKKSATAEQVSKIISKTNELMQESPLTVRLGELDFRYSSKR